MPATCLQPIRAFGAVGKDENDEDEDDDAASDDETQVPSGPSSAKDPTNFPTLTAFA